eukprot:5740283-Prymnesium_polylepis.2
MPVEAPDGTAARATRPACEQYGGLARKPTVHESKHAKGWCFARAARAWSCAAARLGGELDLDGRVAAAVKDLACHERLDQEQVVAERTLLQSIEGQRHLW